MKSKIILLVLLLAIRTFGQNIEQTDSLSMIFMGDIMGHDAQISSAFDAVSKRYNYESVFQKISPIIKSVDFAIANLEVTLGGEPFKGYPQFSSPDDLAVACKNNGIDILVTANNHSCDRSKKGILRTIKILDSLQILHTGSFKDWYDREKNNLLVLSKKNIKIGLLNYTYGTNGLPVPQPTFINRIDTLIMSLDIQKSKMANLDKLIVMLHWGNEYESYPSKDQLEIANFLFKKGVDIIIGSHPHVLQRMEYHQKDEKNNERFIAYSLGNFISDQRTRKRDGGAMLKLTLTKINGETAISDYGYYLTWVYKPVVNNKTTFEILSCSKYELIEFEGIDSESKEKMKLFLNDSRSLLGKENLLVREIKYER